MSKKTGFALPPSKEDRAAKLEAFVTAGQAAEAPAAPAIAKAPPSGEDVRLNVRMPAELHRRFKTACAAEGVSIADVVLRLVEGWTAERRPGA